MPIWLLLIYLILSDWSRALHIIRIVYLLLQAEKYVIYQMNYDTTSTLI